MYGDYKELQCKYSWSNQYIYLVPEISCTRDKDFSGPFY